MSDYVLGVDGCRTGWLACRYEFSMPQLSYEIHPTFAALLNHHPHAQAIAIDIPIGLHNDVQPRLCDREARQLLKFPRASSVFPAPARCLLNASSYADANSHSRQLSGKGLSQQAFRIFPKIAEVDALMTPPLQQRVFEVHPELCFWHMAGRPLNSPKRQPAGYDERRTILTTILKLHIPHRSAFRTLHLAAQPDDLLDAIAASFTAHRIATGKALRVPQTPQVDRRNLRMEIVY